MKLIALGLAVVLAGCAGEINPADVLTKGTQTKAYHSNKPVRDMVVCITPVFDAVKAGSVPISNRLTADGYELLEMAGMGNAYVSSIITVSDDGGGSVTLGYIAAGIVGPEINLRRITSVIEQCV